MTQFCNKMIDFFMIEKPQTKDWRKILVFRDDWSKYRENFFNRKAYGSSQGGSRKSLDINAIVARRRKDFTGEFFRHLTVFSNTYDNLDDRDAIVRLGAKCLSAVRAYDCALEQLEMSDAAQKKFDDILNSSSLDEACEKIKSLAKAKGLDSSLVLLINGAWAAAKESTSMTNEVKEIMHSIYKATKKSLRSIAPPEIKLLKYLLNITDPEQRFSALATAFSPGDEHEAKDVDALYTTPKELHKWIAIMLDAYHLNKEETDLTEARQMSDPIIIQRLNILKETIEDEYMKTNKQDEGSEPKD
uniref:Uncharacterized protein n=1 Tax=Ananas comosus var. bracteatus TaxID=296719 RepID=A0A6V7Q877_ANACO|nr:unnamed protein product [Ananas comosus var. bracteatus]